LHSCNTAWPHSNNSTKSTFLQKAMPRSRALLKISLYSSKKYAII